MSLFCLLVATCICYICVSDATCSFYQSGEISFPTNQCSNSSELEDGNMISGAYHCHRGLFKTFIYYYQYDTANCVGTPINTAHLGTCSLPTCSCDTQSSQCIAHEVSYDSNLCVEPDVSFRQQNLTIVTSDCINSIMISIANDTIFYSNCNGDAATKHRTCYTVNHHTKDTDSIDYVYYTTRGEGDTTEPPNGKKGVFILSSVGAMVFATLCILLCMLRKYRSREQIANPPQKQELLNNHKNGEVSDEPHEMLDIDQNIVNQIVSRYLNDEDDIEDAPAAAYSADVAAQNWHLADLSGCSYSNEGIQDLNGSNTDSESAN
eukprot:386883_1